MEWLESAPFIRIRRNVLNRRCCIERYLRVSYWSIHKYINKFKKIRIINRNIFKWKSSSIDFVLNKFWICGSSFERSFIIKPSLLFSNINSLYPKISRKIWFRNKSSIQQDSSTFLSRNRYHFPPFLSHDPITSLYKTMFQTNKFLPPLCNPVISNSSLQSKVHYEADK